MLGTDARRRNQQRDVEEFLGRFCPATPDKVRGRFFRQAVGACCAAGRWLRWIRDGCREPFYQQKRLLNQLHSTQRYHKRVLLEFQSNKARHVEPDTAIIV